MSKEEVGQQQSELNENTAEVAEPLEIAGGDTGVSFDDLDRAIQSAQTEKTKPTTKTEKGDKSHGKENTDEKEKDDEVKSTKSKEDKDKDPKDGDAQDDKSAKSAKIIKIKDGDKVIELRSDLPVDVKVDGETHSVPLTELLANYSGKTDWQKKYSEMDGERQTFHKDRDTIHQTIQTFYDLAATRKDPKSAIEFLGQVSGTDMVKFWVDFQKQLEPLMEARAKMSPEERKQRDLEEELQLYKTRDERASEVRAKTEQENRIKAQIAKVMQDHGMDSKAFYDAYAELKASGQIPVDKLQPEDVGKFLASKKSTAAVEALLKEVNPEAKDVTQDVQELIGVWKQNPQFTIEQIKDIAVQVYGSKASQNLSRKIKKSEPAQTAKTKKTPGSDPVFFDDL